MPAEGTPREEPLLAAPLGWLAAVAAARPVWILSAGIVLAVVAGSYLALTPEHFKLSSLTPALMALALGVSFGIHLWLAYREERERCATAAEAMAAAAWRVGPAIVTGAMAAAAVFFALAFTGAQELADFGIIAGGGILLGMAVTFTVLPAMVGWFDNRGNAGGRTGLEARSTLPVAAWLEPVQRWPLVTLWLVAAGVIAAGWALPAGPPIEAAPPLQTSYLHAGLYALPAVVLLLVLDFGSTRSALWALAPLGLGLVQTLGIMAWLKIPLTPANLIALPLVIGAGISFGVSVLHDYHRREPGPWRLGASTALGLLASGLAMIAGGGSLVLAGDESLAGLGRVLSLGIASCLLHALVTLPAYLAWRASKQGEPICPPEESAISTPLAEARTEPAPEPPPQLEAPPLPRRPRRCAEVEAAPAVATDSARPTGNPRRRRIRLE